MRALATLAAIPLCICACDDRLPVRAPAPSAEQAPGNVPPIEAESTPESAEGDAVREPAAVEEERAPVDPGEPVDDGPLIRAPSPVNTHIRRLRTGEEADDSGGRPVAPGRYLFGWPAMSADGTLIAVIEDGGDDIIWEVSIEVLRVAGGARERIFRTMWRDESAPLDDAEEEAEANRMRAAAREANQYLRAHGFRSMLLLPRFPDEPAMRGIPILIWDGDRTHPVVIRDPGSSRVRHSALAPGQPRPAADPDNDDGCYQPSPDSVHAYFAPWNDTVLIEAFYEERGDGCGSEEHRDIVHLR